MRIVYISDSAIPSQSPNSVHVMKMCQAFGALGHTVLLLGKNTSACIGGVADIHGFYATERNFSLSIYPTKAFRGSGAFYNLSLGWRVLSLEADLFYTRSISAAFFLLLYGRRVVFEVHEPFEGKSFRLRNMFRMIVGHKKLRKLVVISEALKAYYLKEFHLRNDQIIVAHDAADVMPVATPLLDSTGYKVGYVGSLYPGKGMETIIPLAAQCPEIEFHIVGGSDRQIAEQKQKIKQPGNIIFHGFKTQQEIPHYLASFDAVIAPYLSSVIVSEKTGANNLALWMSPLKIFEYMAAAKPIITTDLPVIREILEHDRTALLCRAGMLDEWVAAVRRLKADPAKGKELSKNAFQVFLSTYTWKQRAEGILNKIKNERGDQE